MTGTGRGSGTPWAGGLIDPIDTGRYGSPEMRALFSDAHRYQLFLTVEAALVRARAGLGLAPEEAALVVGERADIERLSWERITELERETRHEVMAVVRAFAEECGAQGTHVHCGATTSDIIDTALALQIRGALDILAGRLHELVARLGELAGRHRAALMVGRTHGQHALPLTFGFVVAGWMDQLLRHLERLEQIRPRVLVGKMSGAVGTMAGFGAHGPRIQEMVMRDLGLEPPSITTQIVARDRIAEFVCTLALIAGTLESVATDVRNLQRPEIDELREPFDEGGEIGSSTMPQKRNPVLSENISGLARIVRAQVVPSLETIVSWHERDLTNSPVERFTLPLTCVLLDEMLRKSLRLFERLTVRPEQMQRNLAISRQAVLAEAVMLALVGCGMPRATAYRHVQIVAGRSRNGNSGFGEELRADPEIGRHLGPTELDELLQEQNYLGRSVEMTEEILRRAEQVLAAPIH